MAYGAWSAYPWGASGDAITMVPDNSTWNYSGQTYYFHTGSSAYPYSWPATQQIAEKVESAMEWLRRRVVEITDLAYEGV